MGGVKRRGPLLFLPGRTATERGQFPAQRGSAPFTPTGVEGRSG